MIPHPMTRKTDSLFIKSIWSIINEGFSFYKRSNFIFVCGGNDPTHLRKKFENTFDTHFNKFIYFEPEFSIKNAMEDGIEPFDLADFEKMIAYLSYAVVLFPEAAGSFAELGFFSTNKKIAEKTVLVLDSKFQGKNSFIDLGPAKKIAADSIFGANLQIDYANPKFEMIADVINNRGQSNRNVSHFQIGGDILKEEKRYELFCLTYLIMHFFGIATLSDVKFFIRSYLKNKTKPNEINQILSILVGLKMIKKIEETDYYVCVGDLHRILRVKEPYKGSYLFIKKEILSYLNSDLHENRNIYLEVLHAS